MAEHHHITAEHRQGNSHPVDTMSKVIVIQSELYKVTDIQSGAAAPP